MPTSIIILGAILLLAFGVPLVRWIFGETDEEIEKIN